MGRQNCPKMLQSDCRAQSDPNASQRVPPDYIKRIDFGASTVLTIRLMDKWLPLSVLPEDTLLHCARYLHDSDRRLWALSARDFRIVDHMGRILLSEVINEVPVIRLGSVAGRAVGGRHHDCRHQSRGTTHTDMGNRTWLQMGPIEHLSSRCRRRESRGPEVGAKTGMPVA